MQVLGFLTIAYTSSQIGDIDLNLSGGKMYVYADESGNSGRNLFDTNQYFFLAAILSKKDADKILKELIHELNNENGTDRLHAKELGEEKSFHYANRIIEKLTEDNEFRIFIHEIHKPYISISKLVDTIFDAGENKGFPPHWYWDEMHRHMLCLAVDDNIANNENIEFWNAFNNDEIEKIINIFENITTRLTAKESMSHMHDVFTGALHFAKNNTEAFTLHVKQKRKNYQLHTPNIISFTSLIQYINSYIEENGYRDIEIKVVHDQQDEFGKKIKEMYNNFGNLYIKSDENGSWPEAKLVIHKSSSIDIVSSKNSPALQAIDIFLWLHQRSINEESSIDEPIKEFIDKFIISRKMSSAIFISHMKNILEKVQ